MVTQSSASHQTKADLTLKISLAGDSEVGKSSLIRRFVSNTFGDRYVMTLGTRVSSRIFSVSDPQAPGKALGVAASVWDIMGNHDFRSLLKEAFFSNTGAVLMAFDVTRPDTFYNLPQWYEVVASVAGPIPAVVLANKSDLRGPDALQEKEIEHVCRELGWPWIATSAKTAENVEAAFQRVALEYLLAAREAKNAPPTA